MRLDRRNRWLLALVLGLVVASVFVALQVPPAASAYHPFFFDANEATRFELENERGRFVFTRPLEGTWRFAEPIQGAADHLTIAVMVQALETIRTSEALPVEAMPAGERTRAGLGDDAARFVVTAGGRQLAGRIAQPRAIGERTPACADERRGVFAVANRIARMFHGPIDRYRDPRALPFERHEWHRVRLAGPGVAVALEERRPGGEWLVTEPRVATPDPRWASPLLERLPRLRAMGWLSPGAGAPPGAFADPIRSITVTWGYDGPPEEATLEIGASRDASTSWARLAGNPQVYWVGSAAVDSLFPASAEAAIKGGRRE